jgi:outer membrane protein OmpA-like peptidoglycan-associated protein
MTDRMRLFYFFGLGETAALVCLLLYPQVAYAEGGSLQVEQFEPRPSDSAILNIPTAEVAPGGTLFLELWGHYSLGTFIIDNEGSSDPAGIAVIENQFRAELLLGAGLFDALQISMGVPFYYHGGNLGGVEIEGHSTATDVAAIGDLRLMLDIDVLGMLFGERLTDFNLGVGTSVYLPVGKGIGSVDAFAGEDEVRVEPVLSADYRGPWGLHAALVLGVHVRPLGSELKITFGDQVGSYKNGHALKWGVALSLPLGFEKLRVQASLFGRVRFEDNGNISQPIEVIAGLRYSLPANMYAQVAIGTGLSNAIGSPSIRGVFQLGYVLDMAARQQKWENDTLRHMDHDLDTINDHVDLCPREAETENDYHDQDGCPDISVRRADANQDVAPEPENTDTLDGEKLEGNASKVAVGVSSLEGAPSKLNIDLDPASVIHFGVPDALPALGNEPNRDGDALWDLLDGCPDQAEDIDGFMDEDGCPEADNDEDGILDDLDQCPLQAENINNLDDADGCPDVSGDLDADQVEDFFDQCPKEPETQNGVRDSDGCPEALTLIEVAPEVKVAGVETAFAELPAPRKWVDRDGDGLRDAEDRCPEQKEDLDDFEDQDGCPEEDNDGDGVKDQSDQCPLMAETANGFQDMDGCPDIFEDQDEDGVGNDIDQCPLVAETLNELRDHDGCPEALGWQADKGPQDRGNDVGLGASPKRLPPPLFLGDSDGDSVRDDEDLCPGSAEDIDDFNDSDGCPEPDNDEDGILDAVDQCPNEAEEVNGIDDRDGCPDQSIDALKGIVGVVRGIQFRSGSARLRPRSIKVLRKVLKAMTDNPTLNIRVEGYTDSRGSRTSNIQLSQRRAQAVKAWLESRGIDHNRIVSRGLGPDEPIAPNKTTKGRATNRRVQLSYSIEESAP